MGNFTKNVVAFCVFFVLSSGLVFVAIPEFRGHILSMPGQILSSQTGLIMVTFLALFAIAGIGLERVFD